MDLTQRLKYFVSDYSDINADDIDFNQKTYWVSFLFEGYVTQLAIMKSEDNFEIKIINNLHEISPCLQLSLSELEHKVVANIDLINAVDHDCQIPARNGGTWLIKLIDKLIEILKIDQVTLYDISSVRCPLDDSKTSLSLLRIYGSGRSWYEKYGYHVQNNEKQYGDAIKKLIHYPMQEILVDIENFKNKPVIRKLPPPIIKSIDHDYPIVLSIFSKYPPLVKQTLGSYMTELWRTDCKSYNILNYFLISSAKQKNLIWSDAIDLVQSTRSFSKSLV